MDFARNLLFVTNAALMMPTAPKIAFFLARGLVEALAREGVRAHVACQIGEVEEAVGDGPRFEDSREALRHRMLLSLAGVNHGEVRLGVDKTPGPAVLSDLRNGLNIVALRCAHRAAMEDLETRNRAGEAFLEAVVARAGAGLMLTGPDLTIEWCNPEFAALVGLTPTEVLGCDVMRVLLGPEADGPMAGSLASILSQTEPDELELPCTAADGRTYWAQVTARPMPGQEVGAQRRLSVVIDITERMRTLQDLRSARLRADRASRSKSDFIAHMSHELRTPLNAVIGFSDLLLSGRIGPPLDPRHASYVGDIRSSGRHLLEMINDILDLSKVESGAMELRIAAFRADPVVAEVLTELAPAAARKAISLSTDGQLHGDVLADRKALRQALTNLVSNAVKFSSEGQGVTIRLISDASTHRLSVIDRGIGMTREKMERIGQPFMRSEDALVTGDKGAGLGLSITAALMRLMGGELLVESAPGCGTTATLILARG